MQYQSHSVVQSRAAPGVSFTIARMSFGRRVELTRQVRDLAQRMEFLAAGADPKERMDAALVSAEIDRIYLLWGLTAIDGLELDGSPATPEMLAAAGPEELFREALAAVRAECGLSEAEAKN